MSKAKLTGPVRAEITEGSGRDSETYKNVVFYDVTDGTLQFGIRVPCESSPAFPGNVANAITEAVNKLFKTP